MSSFALHLMRHGPPLRTGLFLGHRDVPAAPGFASLAARVATLAFGAMVSSDLERARQGAAAIADERGLLVRHDPRWRELDFGAWDGLDPSVVDQRHLQRFWSDPDGHPPPGGERWRDLRTRVASALAELSSATLIVTHGGAMRAAISVLTGLDHNAVWAFDLPYGSVISMHVWRGDGADRSMSAQVTGLQT